LNVLYKDTPVLNSLTTFSNSDELWFSLISIVL
jgi:hypothetical protein